jgi:hypothetical protein
MIRGLVPSLPERGHIKIGKKGAMRNSSGGKQFQPPVKLDHFEITTMERGEDGNFVRDEALEQAIMEKTGQQKLTRIPIVLLYDDIELNFQSRYAAYAGRTLWCTGDGREAQRLAQSGADKDGMPTFARKAVACPCEHVAREYTGDKPCKFNGSLSAVISGAGKIGGIWKFRTTSYNSVVNLTSVLAFLQRGTGGVLAGIPLMLTVGPKAATSPDGKQQTVYVVGIEFDGTMEDLQQVGYDKAVLRAKAQQRIHQLEAHTRRLLASPDPATGAVFPGETAEDVTTEFYPEQAAQVVGATVIDSDGVITTPASKLDALPTRSTTQPQSTAQPPPDGIEELTGRRTDPKIGLQPNGGNGKKPAPELEAETTTEAVYRNVIKLIDACADNAERQRFWGADKRVKALMTNAPELHEKAYAHYWQRIDETDNGGRL